MPQTQCQARSEAAGLTLCLRISYGKTGSCGKRSWPHDPVLPYIGIEQLLQTGYFAREAVEVLLQVAVTLLRDGAGGGCGHAVFRSEERRVGKACRSRWV